MTSTDAPPMRTLVQGASRGIGLALVRTLLERGEHVVATSRRPERSEALAQLAAEHADRLHLTALDAQSEKSIVRAFESVREVAPRLNRLFNVAGLLHDGDALGPEKRLEAIDPEALRRVFEVNAFGPLLVARHFLPLLDHDGSSLLANVSARVGSIEDNRSGGWYAYRGSKAAQNMFTKTLAIELERRAPRCVCVALHPGTVDTGLSEPFNRRVPEDRLFSPERAARQLLEVVDALGPEDSGGFYAWDGTRIPW